MLDIGQSVPLLYEAHAQHALDTDGRTPPFAALGVMGLNHRAEPVPRNNIAHLGQKEVAPCELLLGPALGRGKAQLLCNGVFLFIILLYDDAILCPLAILEGGNRGNKSAFP